MINLLPYIENGFKIFLNRRHLRKMASLRVKNEINYVRRTDLERIDTSIVIIDVNSSTNYRIINIYRPFNPPNGLSQKEAFAQQLDLIKIANLNTKGRELIILGDFNLDSSRNYDINYSHKLYFNKQPL